MGKYVRNCQNRSNLVVHINNPRARETEVGGSQVQTQAEKPCLKLINQSISSEWY